MLSNRALIGICILSALAFSAFAASSASAVDTTAITCGKGFTGDFTDAHCKSKGSGEFGHKEIGGRTAISSTNINTGIERSVTKLKGVQAGVTLEFQAKVLEGEGEVENSEIVNKSKENEMVAQGTGVAHFKEVTVTAPAGKGCVVKGGEVKTKQLTGTTQEQTNTLEIAPETGETLAEFTVEGCSITSLNHIFKVTGLVRGTIEGATLRWTHNGSTEQNTLFLSGQKVGVEGNGTLSGPGNPLTAT